MDPGVMIVSIVAIVLSYKLLSQIIGKRPAESKILKEAPVQENIDAAALNARAEDLRKRIRTLEEIIASEVGERSRS